jgi:glycosyltransferase 2 family protein
VSVARSSKSASLRWAPRLAGSAVFLGVLLALLPRGALLSALRAVSPWQFAAILAAYCLIHVGAAAKWWIVLGRRIAFPAALRTHFAGLAANLFLPGATGGDAVRAVLAHAAMRDGPRVTAAATADRLVDVVSLATLAIVGIVLPGHLVVTGKVLAAAALLVTGIALGVMSLPRTLPLPWKMFPRLPGKALGLRLSAAFGELGRRKGMLLFAFAASLAIQSLLMALSFTLVIAMARPPSFGAWGYAWPLSKIVSFLPISINGLGVREGAMAAMLAPTGASAASVVAAGLVWQGIMFAGSGVGALAYLLSDGPGRTMASDAAE